MTGVFVGGVVCIYIEADSCIFYFILFYLFIFLFFHILGPR